MHATAAITEQYTLEKVVQAENGGKVRLNIPLPRLESDSADAARINAEIARYYEYDVQEYVDRPEAADPAVWDFSIEMNWEASWYGDCVSLVVSSSYGGTDAPFYDGWCFDFASGNQLTVTQMLQRMGADPVALEEALYRDVKRRDELDRQAAIERGLLPTGSLKEGNTAWWTSLDELPFSLDESGNISFVVRKFSASGEEYVNDVPVIPLDAQPLPPDWEGQGGGAGAGGAVADDCDLLAFENREITVVLIPDLCCHYWHSFSVVGCGAAGRRGYLRCADKSCFARIVSFKPSSILPRTPSQPRWSPQRELGHYWSMDSRVQRTILDNNSAPF